MEKYTGNLEQSIEVTRRASAVANPISFAELHKRLDGQKIEFSVSTYVSDWKFKSLSGDGILIVRKENGKPAVHIQTKDKGAAGPIQTFLLREDLVDKIEANKRGGCKLTV